MIMIQPRQRFVISTQFQELLEFVFEHTPGNYVALGGGTALSEFYLCHRIPNDIDLFFTSRQDIDVLIKSIEQRYGIGSPEEPYQKKAVKLKFSISGTCVKVHFAELKERWYKPGILEKYTAQISNIRLHRIEYIVAEKFNSISEDEKDLFDLMHILQAGVSVQILVRVLQELSFEPDIEDCLSNLPTTCEIDGVEVSLQPFVDQFPHEFCHAWYRQRGG